MEFGVGHAKRAGHLARDEFGQGGAGRLFQEAAQHVDGDGGLVPGRGQGGHGRQEPGLPRRAAAASIFCASSLS